MATISNQRGTVLQIINEVQRRLNYSPTTTLSANRTSLKLLHYLNDVVTHVSDYGDWPQEFVEIATTVAASTIRVEINASAPIKRIMEVHTGAEVAPLLVRDIQDIRVLQRTSGVGTPRQYCMIGTSGINPVLRFHPRNGTSARGFNIAAYTSPLEYVSSDGSKTPPWSRRLLVQGTYALAMLDENDGVPSTHYQANYGMFEAQLREEYNRMGADLGTDVYLTVKR